MLAQTVTPSKKYITREVKNVSNIFLIWRKKEQYEWREIGIVGKERLESAQYERDIREGDRLETIPFGDGGE